MNQHATEGKLRYGRGLLAAASKIILFVIFLAAFALSPPADARPKQPPSGPVVRATLENGLKIIIVKNSLAPVVTTVMTYLVGSNEDPKGFPGTAHATEHMMFRGSPGLNEGQLANIIALLGGKFNAMTQSNITRYFLTIPAEDLDIALHVEAIRMQGILSTEALWNPERGAIEQEVVKDLSSPEFVFYEKLLTDMFKGSPYENSGLGTIAAFNKMTGSHMRKFHEAWYAPNNAVLVVAGDVDPGRAIEKIKKHFDRIPPRKIPARPAIKLEPVQPETIRLKTGNPYGLLILAFRMPGYKSGDCAASQVLSDILRSTRSALYNLVVEGKALATDFELMTHPDIGLGLLIAAFPVGSDPVPLRNDIKRILEESIQKGFPANLVDSAKRNKATTVELEKNSIQNLALAWSDAVTVQGRPSPDAIVGEIARVAPADVDRVARTWLRFDRSVEAVLLPEASGTPFAVKRKGIVESFAPKQVPHAGLPPWAAGALERLHLPKSTLSPVSQVLPNGLTLIFQKQNASDTVVVYGHVKNKPDLQTPPGKEGVDQVMEALFPFGTKSLDRIAFQKALDDIGAVESAGTDFFLKVLTGHFEDGLRLLAENLLHPAFPENAFRTVRAQAVSMAAGLLVSPDFLAGKALNSALFPEGDPTLRYPTPESVKSLTLTDVGAYYKSVFRPDMTAIVVVGNIDFDRVRNAFQKQFGGWTARGKKPDLLLPPVPPNPPASIFVPDKTRVQTEVVLAETVGITRNSPDYYPLKLGNHVLGGAFYATRLFRDLRETTGLVYTVSPSLDAGRTRSRYMVKYACNPDNVARARDIIVYNLKEMQRKPVSEDELKRAKALLLREIPLAESSVDRIAAGFIERTIYNLPLDEPILAAKVYLGLNRENVRAAFAKWIRPGDLVEVAQGPSK
ncbi:MAG: M16 family metallopeptidase [Syntrophales bacterium]